MIRSALRSVSYLVEDMVSVARWAVGEIVSELDYRLQPEHVRQGWAAELADIEAGVDSHEPNAPYLQWGGPETWPQTVDDGRCHGCGRWFMHTDDCPGDPPYCNRCGYPHPTTQTCLRDESSAVPPAAERPAGVVADPPSAPPAGHPYYEVFVPEEDRVPTSELLHQGAVYADLAAALVDGGDQGDKHPYRMDGQAMRRRADLFEAVENTT